MEACNVAHIRRAAPVGPKQAVEVTQQPACGELCRRVNLCDALSEPLLQQPCNLAVHNEPTLAEPCM